MFNIAQLNIATLLAPIDSPQLAGFVANLDRINGWQKTPRGLSGACKPKKEMPPALIISGPIKS